jgi:hypothetical protein
MPEPASSFMVGNAPYPASYAAPLLNFDKLAQLPDDFFKGTQQKRTLALQNAFPKGLPEIQDANGNVVRDKDGNSQIDINAITQKLTKLGGADYATQLLPYLYGSQGADVLKGINQSIDQPSDQQPPTARPSTNIVGASGPANIRGPAPQTQSAPAATSSATQPALSSMGTDNKGADTLRSVVTELSGGRDVPPQVFKNIATAFKIADPDAPLPQGMAEAIRNRLPTTISGAGPQPAPPQQGGQGTSQVTGAGAPINPVGGTGAGGAPAPSALPETPPQGQPPVASSPGTQPAQSQQPGQQPGAALGLSQNAIALAEKDPTTQKIIQGISRLSQAAATYGKFNPAVKDAAEKQIDILKTRLQARLDLASKNAQLTDTQKAAAASGSASPLAYEGAQAVQTATLKHSDALYDGLQSMANSSSAMANNVKLQKALVNNPDFYSGPAQGAALFLKRMVPSLAGSPAPMELYSKVLNNNMLHLIDTMKASSQEMGAPSSRIFSTQIDQVEKSSGTLDNSVTGLRALAELNDRTLEFNKQVGDFAIDYKSGNYRALPAEFTRKLPGQPGVLDANFEQGLRNWVEKHPILSAEEMNDPRVLGARTFETPDKAIAAGVSPGEPIRDTQGRIQYYHGPPAASPGATQAAPTPQRPATPQPAPAPARPQRPQPPEFPL